MDIINILPDSVANQIAAGEVVDRPAGAVKELLENAMDAGAKQIDLVVKDAGRTLLQVTDNGCGMSESDARLCFERHATSKIHRADDLFAIHTMGFRGEALASIAAIAQVELRTRLTGSDLGTQVCIEGSHIVSQQPVACPEGTTMAVKNLFYNVPARRNFLKRDSVELGHIEEVFRRITLIHYDIGFSFVSNGRTLYDLRPGSMLGRIAGLFGAAYKERMYAVDEDTDLVRIHGFVSRPEFGRKTRGEQYIFVNGRFIKHPSLSAAVERAYGDLLPDRTYPSYFIGLTVDPSRIDVNIHPTKTEVKFADDHALFAVLRSAVKRAIGQFSLATELGFDTPDEFNIGPAPQGYIPRQPHVSYNENYNPFHPTPTQTRLTLESLKPYDDFNSRAGRDLDDLDDQPTAAPQARPQQERDELKAPCILLQGRYIVTAISSGLALIDRHRAMERILYDRLSSRRQTADSQTLLFPVDCRFSAADAELLGEMLPELKQYGFEITPRDNTTFVATAIPSDLSTDDLQTLLDQMLVDSKGAAMQRFNDRSQSLCASLARQMASRHAAPTSQEEMQQTVADLFACPMADTTPSGKRIITIVKPEELLR